MAKKVILGQRPPFIRRAVEVLMPDGSIGTIVADFTYRTRTEHADYLDGILKRVTALAAGDAEPVKPKATRRKPKAAPAPEPVAETPWTQRDGVNGAISASVDNLLDILVGWDLDIPFGREGLTQLCNELPGAVGALLEGYRVAVHLGHAGN